MLLCAALIRYFRHAMPLLPLPATYFLLRRRCAYAFATASCRFSLPPLIRRFSLFIRYAISSLPLLLSLMLSFRYAYLYYYFAITLSVAAADTPCLFSRRHTTPCRYATWRMFTLRDIFADAA